MRERERAVSATMMLRLRLLTLPASRIPTRISLNNIRRKKAACRRCSCDVIYDLNIGLGRSGHKMHDLFILSSPSISPVRPGETVSCRTSSSVHPRVRPSVLPTGRQVAFLATAGNGSVVRRQATSPSAHPPADKTLSFPSARPPARPPAHPPTHKLVRRTVVSRMQYTWKLLRSLRFVRSTNVQPVLMFPSTQVYRIAAQN